MFLIGVILASIKNVSAVTTTSESKFALSDLFRWGSKPEVQEGEQSTTLTEEEVRELKNQNGLKHGIYSKRRPSGSAARPECKDCVDGKSNKVCRLRNCRLIKKTICRERSCENMEHMPSGEMPMASGMEAVRVPRLPTREAAPAAGSQLAEFAGTFERVMNPLQGMGGYMNQESGANEGVRNGQEVSSGEKRQYEQNESGPRPSSGWGPQPSSGWGPQSSSGWGPQPSSGWGPQPSSGSGPRALGSGKGHHQYQLHYQNGSGPQPSGSQVQPSGSQVQPSGSQVQPSGSQVQPSGSQVQPSGSQVQPSGSQVQPSGSQVQPSGSQVQPSGSQVQPSGSQVQPSGSQVQPSGSQVQPSGSQVQPSGSQVQPNGSQVQPSGSQVQPSGSQVQPRGSQVQPSGSQVQPSGSQVQPRGSQVQPSGSQVQPRGSQVQPSGSQVQPSGSQVQPSGSQPRTRGQNFIQLNSAATNRKIGEPYNLKANYL
jgi:hypothetical protein